TARRATPRQPDSFSRSGVMTRRQFEALVDRALRRLPRTFKDKLANIAVVVEAWPDDATLAELEIEPPDTLYGLYRGVDLTHRDSTYGNVLPDTVTIYQEPIEEDCGDEREMAELIRDTVVHRSATTSASTMRRWSASKAQTSRWRRAAISRTAWRPSPRGTPPTPGRRSSSSSPGSRRPAWGRPRRSFACTRRSV